MEVALPALITVSNEINKPRYPTLRGIMAAGKKQVPTWDAAALGIDPPTSEHPPRQSLETLCPRPRGSLRVSRRRHRRREGEKLALRLREAKLI